MSGETAGFSENEMGPEAMQVFLDWLDGRPEVIQRMAREYPPQSWWHMASDAGGVRDSIWYTPVSYSEAGTITVRRYSAVTPVVHDVFGVDPEKLIPADSPPPVRRRTADPTLQDLSGQEDDDD